MKNTRIDNMLALYDNEIGNFKHFMDGISYAFNDKNNFPPSSTPVVHSVKSRLKDKEHLREKLLRKNRLKPAITKLNFFEQITDLAGVRVLLLFQSQFEHVHSYITNKISTKEWILNEKPIAYSWDPDNIAFFKKFNITVSLKESHYTSVHYVVKPNKKSNICCEIQIRTLFEEIWGEIDHSMNYPIPTENLLIKNQLRILSKLTSTGSHLADSIFNMNQPI
jgi:ppGpp synthetase/RelA/SpoT-type nucleotidyltranferase